MQLGLARDLRNDPQSPTKGSVVRLGLEQSLPVGMGSIALTRARASYSRFFPIKLVRFAKGPQTLAFNVQGGTVFGDLPPYEAFVLGGSSSVRGYNEGRIGSGRSYVQASAEYRFPLLKFLGGIGGVLFVDYGTLLEPKGTFQANQALSAVSPETDLATGWGCGSRLLLVQSDSTTAGILTVAASFSLDLEKSSKYAADWRDSKFTAL